MDPTLRGDKGGLQVGVRSSLREPEEPAALSWARRGLPSVDPRAAESASPGTLLEDRLSSGYTTGLWDRPVVGPALRFKTPRGP